MLKTPELAMPRSSKVTIVYNGKREVWTDYEEACMNKFILHISWNL